MPYPRPGARDALSPPQSRTPATLRAGGEPDAGNQPNNGSRRRRASVSIPPWRLAQTSRYFVLM